MKLIDIVDDRERSDMVFSILRNEKAPRSFARVSIDIASLRRPLTAVNASSISTSSTGSVLRVEDSSFDDLVINSKAYRNVFVRSKADYNFTTAPEEAAHPSRPAVRQRVFPQRPPSSQPKSLKKGRQLPPQETSRLFPEVRSVDY
jgi:hypothetical protein